MMRTEKKVIDISTDLILDNLLDAVLIVDQEGIVLYANKTAEKLFCIPVTALIGEHFGFPVTPYEVQEIQVLRRDEVATLQMLASVINSDGKEVYLLSLRDITDQKEVELELDKERRKLEVSNLENEQYASLASHDLKEPVRKILIFSDIVLKSEYIKSGHPIFNQLKKIHSSAQRMHFLLTGIAEFSKVSKGKHSFSKVDLNQVIDDVWTDLEIVVQETNAKMFKDHLPTIEAVPVQMHQLFLNLISNSIKYGREGVAPKIEVKARHEDEQYIQLTLSDNGIGFENQFAEKVFAPFARLHGNSSDGSGIGLAICKKIVEVHGGQITVNSSPGNGSLFEISLSKTYLAD